MKKKQSSIVSLALAVLALLLQPVVHAAGTTVSPAYVRFSVSEKQPTDVASVFVKNSNATQLVYEARIVDVDTATGSLMPQDTTSQINRRLYSVSVPEFSLKPEQSINIGVTATNFADLPPGGHYAALTIKQKSTVKQAKNVPIQPIISVGLFLVKEDGAVRQLQMSQQKGSSVWFKKPSTETFVLANNGNVDVVPSGFVAVQQSTDTLFKQSINTESQPLLPKATKEYKVNYTSLNMRWPGKYQKVIAYRYVSDENMTVVRQDVWYMPLWFVCGVLGMVAIITLFIKKKRFARKSTQKTEEEVTADTLENEPDTHESHEPKIATKMTRKKSSKSKK